MLGDLLSEDVTVNVQGLGKDVHTQQLTFTFFSFLTVSVEMEIVL